MDSMDTSKLSQDKKGVDPEEVKGLSKTTEDSCETAVIDPNKIITKDSLRLHMPGAEESELEKDAAGLNYVAGLSGQIALHKLVTKGTSKEAILMLASLKYGYEVTDAEMAEYMSGKTLQVTELNGDDGKLAPGLGKPSVIMRLGNYPGHRLVQKLEGLDLKQNGSPSSMSIPARTNMNTAGPGTVSTIGDKKQIDESAAKETWKTSAIAIPARTASYGENIATNSSHRIGVPPLHTGVDARGLEYTQPLPGVLYQPLNSESKEIRLLSLSKWETFIHRTLSLKMENVPLDQAPNFTALSYVWGGQEASARVMCNGQGFCITKSLYNTLARVLNWDQQLYLWADGICINQQDPAERGAQVGIMDQIYTQAMRTAAYLGEPDSGLGNEPENAAIALMKMFSRMLESDPAYALRSHELWKSMQIPRDQAGQDAWRSILALWKSPWFSRAWILQEVVLAKNILVFYGQSVTNLDDLTQFWSLVEERDVPPLLKFGSTAELQVLVRGSNQLGTIKRLRERKYAKSQPQSSELPKSEGKKDLGQNSLLEHLILSRGNGATDSRDKVYSLLGMAEDLEDSGIYPCYDNANSAAKVYQKVSELYISRGHTIGILHHSGLPQRIEGLPTWIPDWSFRSRFPFKTSLYNCSGTTIPRTSLDPGTPIITIRVAFLDTFMVPTLKCNFRSIESTGYLIQAGPGLTPPPQTTSDEHMRRQIHLCADLTSNNLLTSPYFTGEDLDEALWRTLTANRGWAGENPTDIDRSSYEAFVRSYPSRHDAENADQRIDNSELRQESWPFEKAMQDVHRGRQFGITACGYMGLFPNDTKTSDSLVMILGAKMPFVLRKVDVNEYLMIGDCYIHGVMEGEWIHSWDCEKESILLDPSFIEKDVQGRLFSVVAPPLAPFMKDFVGGSLPDLNTAMFMPFQDIKIR
ncbi:hypothetical protein ACEPPN_019526 [Leptodophora sp. 'Broadleaf-Isolate-01']